MCPAHLPCKCDDHALEELEQLRLLVAELSAQVQVDELTGLYNYRHLLCALSQEIERAKRTGGEFSLLMIDFDNFKSLNDSFGHEFGNQVLRAAGTFFIKSLRKLDVPCRFGGEEFVVVLPGTDLAEARNLAERLRQGIEELPLIYGDRHIGVTVSVGVDTFGATEQSSPELLINRADQQLLQAKKAGKNTVCYAEKSDRADGMSIDEKMALMDSFKSQRS